MNVKFFVLLIIAFALGAGLGYYFGYDIGFERAAKSPAIRKSSQTTSGFRIGRSAIYVPDQVPGQGITVSFVALEEAGFVVIHQAEDGKPGAVIGQSDPLPAGEHENIWLSLGRASQDGETLFAILHHDNGDGVFNLRDDGPLIDEGGQSFMMQFMIDKDAVVPGAVSL